MKSYNLKEFDRYRHRILEEAVSEEVLLTKYGTAYVKLVPALRGGIDHCIDHSKGIDHLEEKGIDLPVKGIDLEERRVHWEDGEEYLLTFEEVIKRVGEKAAPKMWRGMARV